MTTDDLTGAALNRAIAERLGYHPCRNIAGGIDIAGDGFLWGNCTTEEEAWRDALAILPDWANDPIAARELLQRSAPEHFDLLIDIFDAALELRVELSQSLDSAEIATALARLALAAL